MSKYKRKQPLIVVAKGGVSMEQKVSLQGAKKVEDALENLGCRVVGLEITQDFLGHLLSLKPDFIWIQAHGRLGEDGALQELLNATGIPYVSSETLASYFCMHKVLFKRMMRREDIPTPDFYSFTREALERIGAYDGIEQIVRKVHFPLFVKPDAEGSGIGIKYVTKKSDLAWALTNALGYDNRVMIEQRVVGRELALTILGEGETLEYLPLVEIKTQEAFYNYEAHYIVGKSKLAVPRDLTKKQQRIIQDAATRAYRLAGCRDWARVDLILDKDNTPQILEINTVPGLTDTSLTTVAADLAGIEFEELVARIAQRAAKEAGYSLAAGGFVLQK